MPIATRKYSRRSRRRPETLRSGQLSSFYQAQAEVPVLNSTLSQAQAETAQEPEGPIDSISQGQQSPEPELPANGGINDRITDSVLNDSHASRQSGRDNDDAVGNERLNVQQDLFGDVCNKRPRLPCSSSDDDEVDDSVLNEYIDNPVFSLFDEHGEEIEETEENELQQLHLLNDSISGPSRQPQSLVNTPEEVQRAEKLLRSLKKHMSRPVFLALISLYGKTRFTLDHYDHLVAMMQDGENGVLWPCATTMRKHVFPRLVKSVFVQSSIETFPTKSTFISYVSKSPKLSKKQSEAVVVLPSSWMKMDVRSLHVLRELVCIDDCRCFRRPGSNDLRVDSSNFVTNRVENSRLADTLWINKDGVPAASSPGMMIRLHTSDELKVLRDQCAKTNELDWKTVKFRGEVCTAFHVEIVSTVHVRYSAERGVYLEEGRQDQSLNDSFAAKYRSSLAFIETLCQAHHTFPCAAANANEVQTNPDAPQTRRQLYRRQSTSSNRMYERSPYLVPSDHLTIVKYGPEESIGVLVSRFWVDRLHDERNFFFFISSDEDREKFCTRSIPTFSAPVYVRGETTPARSSEPAPACKTKGRLQNGMRFYNYRVLLYADDFNPRSSLFPKGSVGGIYMNPSSFHVRSRRSQLSIRTISVTPAGVSTNSVISFIIDDLVKGCTDGFVCVDAFGEKVTVFLDVMGFIGDYPASTAVVDLKGHNAISPCTVCGFTINSSPGELVYAFTTSITSRHSAYRRTQERSLLLREVGLTAAQEKVLGMRSLKKDEVIDTDQCPLIKFACMHNERMKDVDVAPGFPSCKKDGYMLNLIAPDHLITGLFKGLLTIIFLQLPDAPARNKVQICLKASLSEFGFQSQNVIFKEKKKKLVPGLSMSTLYAIMTVLPSTLKALNLLDNLPSKQMLVNLHMLFGLAFWWPTLNQDGRQSWNFVHGTHMKLFHRSLQVLAANFVKSVQKFSKSYFQLANHVDKPNIHRLLELVHHSIPLFNHIGYFCELVFESAHQPLKFFLSRNHSLNSHIYSVQLILAKDWMVRLWSVWSIYRDERESADTKHYALIGLLRLLLGGDVDTIDWKLNEVSSALTEMREHVECLMKGTVHKRFYKWYHDARMTFQAEASWVIQLPPKRHKFPDKQGQFLKKAVAQLASLRLEKEGQLKLGIKALLDRGFGSTSRGSHERLALGDVVQVLLRSGSEDKKFLNTYMSNNGTPHFFVVGGFIKKSSHVSWAVVNRCTILSPSDIGQIPDLRLPPLIEVTTQNFYDPQRPVNFHYLELSNKVHKVGTIHNCSKKGGCLFSFDTRQVSHSCTTLEGGHFFILSRSMGYPPRRS